MAEKAQQSGSRRRAYFLIGGVVVFLACAVWLLSFTSSFRAGYQAGGQQPVFVKGVVLKNVSDKDVNPLSGQSYLEVLDQNNAVQTIYYARSLENCASSAVGETGSSMQAGEKVTIFGMQTGKNEFTVCSSEYFYIEPMGQTGPYGSWLTYADPQAGFEFKYPQNWIVSTSSQLTGNIVRLAPPNEIQPAITITTVGGTSDFVLSEWATSYFGVSTTTFEAASVGGTNAIVFPVSNGQSTQNILLAKHGDTMIQFEFPDPANASTKELAAIPALLIKSVLFDSAGAAAHAPPSAPASTDSGVTGSVMIGPTCPVMQNPPQAGCEPKAYQAKLRIIGSDGTVAARFATNADGTFAIPMPPGVYRIENDASGAMPSLSPYQLVIPPHTIVPVTLSYDSGIR
jgi:hypothetical protein